MDCWTEEKYFQEELTGKQHKGYLLVSLFLCSFKCGDKIHGKCDPCDSLVLEPELFVVVGKQIPKDEY